MTIQTMRKVKKEFGISNQEISRRTGLPICTTQRFFPGKTEASRMHMLQVIPAAKGAGFFLARRALRMVFLNGNFEQQKNPVLLLFYYFWRYPAS